jgi:RHS repeat-associated protein
LIDFVGAIIELYAFDAYGNAIGFDPSVALTEFLYSGEQIDSKIGQQYLRQRYYDPATGRFNRLDPFFGNLTDPQSLLKYLYTHADPVNGVDPTGLSMMMDVMSSINARIQVSLPAIKAIFSSAISAIQKLYASSIYQKALFTFLVGSDATILTFGAIQGRLTADIAAMYALRGFLGLGV